MVDVFLYIQESPNPETSATGRDCLKFLGQFLGPNILKSRVELYDMRYEDTYIVINNHCRRGPISPF
jgi:hypothetical protein